MRKKQMGSRFKTSIVLIHLLVDEAAETSESGGVDAEGNSLGAVLFQSSYRQSMM